MSATDDVTLLLSQLGAGDASAADRLVALVYEDLRSLAARRMAGERDDHTLGTTALVHEAYLKVVGRNTLRFEDRSHFFAVAAEAMRRLLVDHARRRDRLRRGGDRQRQTLPVDDLASEENPAATLALDEALQRLEKQDPRMAQVVKLRFFAGLSIEETADALQLSPRTVKREWSMARAWLHRALQD